MSFMINTDLLCAADAVSCLGAVDVVQGECEMGIHATETAVCDAHRPGFCGSCWDLFGVLVILVPVNG